MREISIQKNEAGQRMDKFLAKYLNKAPKSFFYKMMRKKNITLNGKKAVGNEKAMKLCSYALSALNNSFLIKKIFSALVEMNLHISTIRIRKIILETKLLN